MDKKIQMVNLLLDTIEQGLMNAETIGCFTYDYLAALLNVSCRLEGGRELYREIKNYLERVNIQKLRTQLNHGERITVGFIANYASTWIGDELYHLLEQSNEFQPYIFLMPNHASGQSSQEVIEEYTNHLDYFRKRNLQVVQTLDLDSGFSFTWEQIGISPQLCIWLTPWSALFGAEQFDLQSYPLDTIHTYIPYCFMIPDNKEGDFVYDQYNQLLHNIAWKIFEENRIAVEMAGKYSFIGGESNAIYTGYPKMDAFYKIEIDEEDPWDALIKKAENPKAKKIIYAPHHTLGEHEPIHFSTFASNYMLMLELAEKYQDETVWIFKPHPQLKYKAVQEGIFADSGEWTEYEQKWRKLKNADVMKEGMYHKLLQGSDAMILDSVSFLAEYMYVQKPLLRLRRDGQYFNDFGKQLVKVHYSADGTDEAAIEKFITDVVISGKDKRKEERRLFFEENLNYRKKMGKSAAENIFEQLKKIADE